MRRVEYECLVERGLFEADDRIELIDGLLVVREPQSSAHAVAVQLAQRALHRAFGAGWDIRPHAPVALDDDSEPEPDVSIVAGDARDYVAAHPSRPVLVVEVSLRSLDFDREYKSSLYARAGVTDYWIVNLVDRALEVRRQPATSEAAPYGWTYDALAVLGPDGGVSPLAAPLAWITVAELLP
ncbi:MAG: Uma2 family endonuclease [Candidatus Rokubacteria bacterium]|nr:Uma2 family endonuclease [Candidatus Rokubacteria bacterium]